ncbi:MAG: glycosyltransferase [Candidatus Cloacimonetes bacterium]|nr:glycosyltransferase [Candidatus Cloacimonadota bacterium]
MAKLLSVIVPAYQQEKTIAKDLERIKKVLAKLRYDYEMICVVDGQVDKTWERAEKAANEKIKVVGYQQNHGKGYAVRFGMAKSRGDFVLFIDAGMEIDPNGISMLLEHLEWYNADIIVGSKLHPASKVKYSRGRRLLSFGYRLLVRLFTGLKIADTQAGIKIFRREVLADTLPRLMVKRFAFDLEILSVAHRLGYRKIFEAPIELDYTFSPLSRAATWQGIKDMLIDTLAIFYRLHILRYYDDKNAGHWRPEPDLGVKSYG